MKQTSQTTTQGPVCDLLDKFITAFQQAKGHRPDCISITGMQSVQFGLSPGDRYHGVAINIV